MSRDYQDGAEPDQFEGAPHPREQLAFFGHQEGEGEAEVVATALGHEPGGGPQAGGGAGRSHAWTLGGGAPGRQGGEVCPRQDSNLRTRLRRPMLYPLSYGGQGRR